MQQLFPFPRWETGGCPGRRHFHRREPTRSESLSSLPLEMVRRDVPMRDPRRLEGSPTPREVNLISSESPKNPPSPAFEPRAHRRPFPSPAPVVLAQAVKDTLLLVLKIVPLALYLRSAACKYSVPILGCDGELCPVAIGKKGDCVPTANTAEQLAWCEHAWTPWANGLMSSAGIDYRFKCSAGDGHEFAKIIGAIEVWGYVLLWAAPQMGAFILTALMTGAVHFHLTFLKDKPEALVVQFALLAASCAVMMLSADAKAKKVKKA